MVRNIQVKCPLIVSNICFIISGGMKQNIRLFVLSHYRLSPALWFTWDFSCCTGYNIPNALNHSVLPAPYFLESEVSVSCLFLDLTSINPSWTYLQDLSPASRSTLIHMPSEVFFPWILEKLLMKLNQKSPVGLSYSCSRSPLGVIP